MRSRTNALTAAILWLMCSPVAASEMYRWVDERGGVHFTSDLSQVPPAQRESARAREAAPRRERIMRIEPRAPSRKHAAPRPAPSREPAEHSGPSASTIRIWKGKVRSAQARVKSLERSIKRYEKAIFAANSWRSRARYEARLDAAKDDLREAKRAASRVEQDARREGLEWGDLR